MLLRRHPYVTGLFVIVWQLCITSGLFCQQVKRLQFNSFNVNEGLLHSQVLDLVEDGNGFIWISTGNGLQRFDGRTFHQIKPGNGKQDIPDDKYVRLFSLQNGNLLFKHQLGISEYDSRTNRFNLVFQSNHLKGEFVPIPIGEEGEAIWAVVIGRGFYKINLRKRDVIDSIAYPNENTRPAFKPGNIIFMQINSTQYLFCNLSTRQSFIIKPDHNQLFFYASARYSEDTLLLATSRGIEKFSFTSGISTRVCAYASPPSAAELLHVRIERIKGDIFMVSEDNQLYEFDARRCTYVSKIAGRHSGSILQVGYFTKIIPDSFDNVWLLSENNGAFKLKYTGNRFRYFGTPDKDNNFVKSIYVDKAENKILCGSFGKGLFIYDTSENLLHSIHEFPGVTGSQTVCAFRKIASNEYLVFLMGDWNIYRLDTKKFTVSKCRISWPETPSKIQLDYHLSLFDLDDSTVLLQNGLALYRISIQSSSIIPYQLLNFSPASTSSYLDRNKRLWVGAIGSYSFGDPDYTHFSQVYLQEKIFCRNFLEDANGNIWMGTEKGLYMLNSSGKIMNIIREQQGLPDENIYAIRQDKTGNLWLSHNQGISCMLPDGNFLHFGKTDGLQENEFNTNTYYETRDGEVFFGGVNGITSFYPEAVIPSMEKPRLLFTSIKVKDREWDQDSAVWNLHQLDLPYGENHVAFEFTALGSRSPDQYNYQYRMKGADDSWINSERVGSARYSLSPGNYLLEVWAGSSFDKGVIPLKSIAIIIHPPFWKKTWFIVTALFILMAMIFFITLFVGRSRLKKKIQELEQKRAVDQERLRIAREMHDDIGAGLTQITMMSEAARKSQDKINWAEEIASTSRKLVGNMSEIIWSMNPANNTLQQLLSYLREQLNYLLQYSGIDYTIDFPESDQDVMLNHAQCRNLLLVTKEVVHNSIRHSGAGKIRVRAAILDNYLQFEVEDNGQGFQDKGKSKGNGLRNINHRVEELGGSLQIESHPGEGTLFRYKVPLISGASIA